MARLRGRRAVFGQLSRGRQHVAVRNPVVQRWIGAGLRPRPDAAARRLSPIVHGPTSIPISDGQPYRARPECVLPLEATGIARVDREIIIVYGVRVGQVVDE